MILECNTQQDESSVTKQSTSGSAVFALNSKESNWNSKGLSQSMVLKIIMTTGGCFGWANFTLVRVIPDRREKTSV